MRVVFKQRFDTPTDTLCALSGLSRVEDRMFGLTEKYLEAAIQSSNELILILADGFIRSFKHQEMTLKTVLCDFWDILETIV